MKKTFCIRPEFYKGYNSEADPVKLEMTMETLKTVIDNGFGPVFMSSFTLTPHPYLKSRHTDGEPTRIEDKWFLPVGSINSSTIKKLEQAGEFWTVTTSSGTQYLIIE